MRKKILIQYFTVVYFTGSMCVCYSQPLHSKPELMYTLVLVHKGV